VLAVIAAAVPAALAILGILAGVCYLIGAVLWFRSRPKKPKPAERSTGPQPQSIAFVDVLDRQDAALYTKIPAVMVGDLNARRMQRARIRARSTLVDEFRREPSAAELAAAAQFLFDLNGTEIKVSEEEIRSYFDAGGTISPELRPWNEEARKDDPAAIHQGGRPFTRTPPHP
jgi:hypothetical protein